MHLPTLLAAALAFTTSTSAWLTYSLQRVSNPTSDQQDAYNRITAAMDKAVARYNRLAPRANKYITVQYVPSVQTADGNINGNIRFGSDRAYMSERTALHGISHTLGVGTHASFDRKCAAQDWPNALRLLRSWDGQNAKINCGGGHFWPYGLNYDNEFSETNADRHCLIVDAMIQNGLGQ